MDYSWFVTEVDVIKYYSTFWRFPGPEIAPFDGNKTEPFWLFETQEIIKIPVSGNSKSQKGSALFQEAESFKKMHYKLIWG